MIGLCLPHECLHLALRGIFWTISHYDISQSSPSFSTTTLHHYNKLYPMSSDKKIIMREWRNTRHLNWASEVSSYFSLVTSGHLMILQQSSIPWALKSFQMTVSFIHHLSTNGNTLIFSQIQYLQSISTTNICWVSTMYQALFSTFGKKAMNKRRKISFW